MKYLIGIRNRNEPRYLAPLCIVSYDPRILINKIKELLPKIYRHQARDNGEITWEYLDNNEEVIPITWEIYKLLESMYYSVPEHEFSTYTEYLIHYLDFKKLDIQEDIKI